MIAKASDVQAGDKIAGWDGYTVVGWSAHPHNPADGKITLRPDHRTTYDTCWTPKRADDDVEVLNR